MTDPVSPSRPCLPVRWAVLALGLASVAGCGRGDPRKEFLPLDRLCEDVAAEACAARQRCCDARTPDCAGELTRSCTDDLQQLTEDGRLRYESGRAASLLDAQIESYQRCRPQWPTAVYFVGIAAEGESCELPGPAAGVVCAEGLQCGADGRCAQGASCGEDHQCEPGRYCDAAGRCVAGLAAGGACERGAQCLSGACDGAQCLDAGLCEQLE